jgi:hypothetical protein
MVAHLLTHKLVFCSHLPAGGFCLKGISQVVDVVAVMPAGLEQRLQHLLPAASCNKVSDANTSSAAAQIAALHFSCCCVGQHHAASSQ